MSQTYLLLGRTGDIASVLPFLKHEADAGEKPRLVVSKDYSGVLEGVSYVEPVEFAGKVEQLKEGWDWAKGQFGEVKSLQVIGERNIVAECTYQPAGQDGARTTSFVKEAWKLAGKMPLWDNVLPLVFDRRDPAREEKLIESCGLRKPGRKKPIILVSTSGTSSPFAHADLLYQLVWLKFKGRYNVMRLPQAERFYDLLALYEQAHCLVTTDSAPLHLARACPDLPVMALTNDRPLLWNGSAWLPNWHWCCRYHDFPDRALQLLEAIHTCRERPKHPFIHVWNAYDGGPAPERYTRDALPVFAGMCGRDSANTLKDEKRIPYLRDCLRMALQRAGDDDWVVMRRPETQIAGDIPQEPCFAYRLTRNGEGDQFAPIGEMFSAPKSFWKSYLNEIPDVLFGSDYYWSIVLWAVFKNHGARDVTGLCWRPKSNKPRTTTRDVPRLKHNKAALDAFSKQYKLPEDHPRIAEQVQAHPLEIDKLFKWGYNPTLIEHGGKYWLCYRYHEGTLSTKLALAEIHPSGKVISNQALDIPGESVEDPKFFTRGQELHLSWVETKWPKELRAVVKYAPLVNGKIGPVAQPIIENNNWLGIEKNWCFFERNGALFCIYQRHPVQRIFRIEDNIGTPLPETPVPHWPYGAIKGGSMPVEYEGKLLSFCHSRLDNELCYTRHRYYLAAVLMNPDPPFNIVQMSKTPVVYGSADDVLTSEERKSCIHYKAKVVFEGGLVRVDDYLLLSMGENDSACVIAKVRPNQFNF